MTNLSFQLKCTSIALSAPPYLVEKESLTNKKEDLTVPS